MDLSMKRNVLRHITHCLWGCFKACSLLVPSQKAVITPTNTSLPLDLLHCLPYQNISIMKLESLRITRFLSISVLLFRWPCGRGVVTVECVFSHMWAGLASEDEIMCFLSLWDSVQRSPAGNTHVQQHRFLSRRTWDHRLRYVYWVVVVLFCHRNNDERWTFICAVSWMHAGICLRLFWAQEWIKRSRTYMNKV